jgi:hypothetical protein
MHIHNKISLLAFVLLVFVSPLRLAAQNEEDLANFLKAGEEDASKLMTAYLEPIVKSMSYGMAGGWYHTAKTHKSLGIDVGVTMNLAFIPTSDNFFNPNSLNLSATTYDGARPNGSGALYDPNRKAPTIFGPKDETQYTSTYTDPVLGVQSISYNGPEGFDVKKEIGFAAAPAPMIQLGIGVIKNTDLKIRFVPKQEFGSSTFNMFGVGVLHDIKQHIKGIKMLPFDLSALVAYNSVSGTTDLSNSNPSDGTPDSDNGNLDFKFNSWVIQALISKKISVLTGYAGFGYSMVDTKVDVKGDYVIDPGNPTFVLTNPVAIDYKNNSMRLTFGMRLKLGPVYLNGDYTFQKYNTLSVGLGVTVR